ncbi:MAG: LmbE family N-acetylglucosaminyl deacetylase [Verrucomicrobiales bacterium]|jgi:LmbE family N-acetylglucosaminyl deacetylase
MSTPVAIAVAAHPDDIEFVMAGTLLRLKAAGWETHYLNLSSGNCGSQTLGSAELAAVRLEEAQAAAKILGAHFHAPFTHDLEIFYDLAHLRRLAAILHDVAPDIVLTHAHADYMEDHMITARLAVTAAFSNSMPNFRTDPPVDAPFKAVAVYHAMPLELRDGHRRSVVPQGYVDVSDLQSIKRQALAAHNSQKEWLDVTQGMDSYLRTMEEMDRLVGVHSGRFVAAEGWCRHDHRGFSAHDWHPLATALGDSFYEQEEMV